MKKINNNGMSHKVVATNIINNNNINDYKFFVTGGHEFDSFDEGIRFTIEHNYALLVRGEKYKDVRIAVLRNSDGYRLHVALLNADFSAKISRDYPMGVRMTAKKINGDITNIVLSFLDEVEKIDLIDGGYEYFNNCVNAMCEGYGEDENYRLMDIMDEAIDYMETDTDYSATEHIIDDLGYDMEDMEDSDWSDAHAYIMIGARRAYEDMNNEAEDWDAEKMDEIVAKYQEQFDGYVADLKKIGENYDALTYGIDYLRVGAIAWKMANLGQDLLDALGDYTNCEMGEDDGYWLDTEDFEKWACGAFCGRYISDIEDFAENAIYMATDEDRIAPMSKDEYNLIIENFEWENGKIEDFAKNRGVDCDYVVTNILLDYLDEIGVVDEDRTNWVNRVLDAYFTERHHESEYAVTEMPF